jgi:hypothetical protein
VTEVDRSLLNTSSKQIITTVLPKKTTDTPPINQPGKTGPKLSIFEKYDLIKKKNQTLTNNTYAQFWKQTSTAQHRLLSAFDMEKGRMHMAFLQAQVPDPKVITDYKRETFEFQTKDVHPADQMDLHRQTGRNGFLHAGTCFHYCLQVTSVSEQCPDTVEVGENIILCQG